MKSKFPNCLGTQGKSEYEKILVSQWWSPNKLKEETFNKQKAIINFAYKNIQFYRRLFNETGFNPKVIKNPEDLSLMPFITKQDLQNNFLEFLSDEIDLKQAHISHTSGSSGMPLKFYITNFVDEIEYAYLWRHWNWANFHHGDKAVVIRGLKIPENKSGHPPYYIDRENGRYNLYISSYHLSETNLNFYLELISQFQPKIIRAYPSTLDILTRYASLINYRLRNITSIITSSETLLPSIRDRAENYWGCKIFDWYGQRERVAAIGQCEYGNYHINQEYSYVELRPITNDLYEIIGSSFNNFIMPLIKYATGDLVQGLNDHCPCGRGLSSLRLIEGRCSQVLKALDGRWLFPSILQDVFEPNLNIKFAKIIQKKIDEIEVEIVPSIAYSDIDQKKIDNTIRNLIGKNVNINFTLVPEIIPGLTGKRTLIESFLPEPFS